MPSPFSRLSTSEQRQLLDDLHYLNMGEIKTFCKAHSIPFMVFIETSEGGRRSTSACDRKGVILKRIRYFLKTGKVLEPTLYTAQVIRLGECSVSPKKTDRIFYGQYDKSNSAMFALLGSLTDGHFKDGAISRILANDFWSRGIAPTYMEYAAAWREAKKNHKRPNLEWAFLSDRADRKDTTEWKKLRTTRAKRAMRLLGRIASR